MSKTIQDRDTVTMEDYVAYGMAPTSITFNDLEGHFSCLKISNPIRTPININFDMFRHLA